jgi:hypothetical protein
MNRRKLSHIIAAGILAALLALPGPAGAGTPRAQDLNIWQSLAKLWQNELAALQWDGLHRKEGYGIDPNGGKPTGSNSTTPPPVIPAGTTGPGV